MERTCSACDKKHRPSASTRTSAAATNEVGVLTRELAAYRINTDVCKPAKSAKTTYLHIRRFESKVLKAGLSPAYFYAVDPETPFVTACTMNAACKV
jgi:hypothetical protein